MGGKVIPEGRKVRRPVPSDGSDRRKVQDRKGERRAGWTSDIWEKIDEHAPPASLGRRKRGSDRRVAKTDPRGGVINRRQSMQKDRRSGPVDRRIQEDSQDRRQIVTKTEPAGQGGVVRVASTKGNKITRVPHGPGTDAADYHAKQLPISEDLRAIKHPPPRKPIKEKITEQLKKIFSPAQDKDKEE